MKNGLIILLLLIIYSTSGVAKDIHVYPNKISGIQTAFNNALAGDRIVLHKGDYFEILRLTNKSNISIVASGDGAIKIYGVMPEFVNQTKVPWKFIKKERNKHFKNQQWVYEAAIPNRYQEINRSLPDYWTYRNNLYFNENEMLWSYDDLASFQNRKIRGTNGEGVFFGKDKIILALNKPIEDFPKTQYVTYSGQVLATGNLANVTIDGGKDQLIEFMYAGRYCISVGGELNNVTFKNLKIINPNDAFYFLQCTGQNVTIENCILKKNVPFDCLWMDIKKSKSMEGSAIVYASGELRKFDIRKNTIEGFFNGILVIPGNVLIEKNHLKNIGDDAIELEGPVLNTICRKNFIENAFISISLVPVEKGPVYIYDNIIYSNVKSYPYEYLKDGSIREIETKLLKFWNLKGGEKLKNGKHMKVSGNVHFYYNTFISKTPPLTLGVYNKKEFSPINSTFYNNVFLSDGVITNYTGFAEDGIDIDNNVFCTSYKNLPEGLLFIGWDGPNHFRTLTNNNKWTNNAILKLSYKWKRGNFKWCKESKKALSKFKLKSIPSSFPENDTVNKRTIPGASF